MRLLGVDTETCSLKGDIIELAMVTADEELNIISIQDTLIKPTMPIEPSASCVHGITNEMVEDKPMFKEATKDFVIDYGNDIFIAHNAPFDKEHLIREGMTGLADIKTLDTLTLARNLLPKRYGNDKLGALFYGYGCYKTLDYEGDSHRADYDVMMMLEVLRYIMEEFKLTIQEAYEIANKPVSKASKRSSSKKMSIGKMKCWLKKYKGETWQWVKENDPEYCKWIIRTFDDSDKDLVRYLKRGLK